MPFVIAMDYDGTLFTNSWPDSSACPNHAVISKLKEFLQHGACVALWTCREGAVLDTAIEICKRVGLQFHSVNENAPVVKQYLEKHHMSNPLAIRKIMASIYVDDSAPGSIDSFLKMDAKQLCETCANSFT